MKSWCTSRSPLRLTDDTLHSGRGEGSFGLQASQGLPTPVGQGVLCGVERAIVIGDVALARSPSPASEIICRTGVAREEAESASVPARAERAAKRHPPCPRGERPREYDWPSDTRRGGPRWAEVQPIRPSASGPASTEPRPRRGMKRATEASFMSDIQQYDSTPASRVASFTKVLPWGWGTLSGSPRAKERHFSPLGPPASPVFPRGGRGRSGEIPLAAAE